MNNKRNISIKVPVLTRVEGEGALELDIKDNQIQTLNLRIYEPPRYFEKFLENRNFQEVPDMVARICGICPVAYQMSAAQALENAFSFTPSAWVNTMRRLLYCGEWIQSHSLHIHLLAAPDFLGFNSIIEMSKDYPDVVQRGLKLQDLGNQIIQLLGGRSVHPVGVLVGGFYKAPSTNNANDLLEKLIQAKQDCFDLIEWTCRLTLPDNQQEFISVALKNDTEYPMLHGRLVSSHGLDIPIDEYEHHFNEFQVAHSTALHALLDNKPYLVGPLARLNLNHEHISDDIRKILESHNITLPAKNMFNSIIARAVELTGALCDAIDILSEYTPSKTPYAEIEIMSGTGFGCTEAPRGILWHKYETDDTGTILSANIIPPTSQNQAQIEKDLRDSIMSYGLDKTDDDLKLYSETIIRNYDPCISCATHFLKLKINRQ